MVKVLKSMSTSHMLLVAILVIVPSVQSQLGGLFGGSRGTNKDTVVIGCGSTSPLVYTGSDHSLNVLMNGQSGSEGHNQDHQPQSPLVLGCQGSHCNQYAQNPLVPVLKNSIPIPVEPQIPSALARMDPGKMLAAMASELGLTDDDLKEIGHFQTKMKSEGKMKPGTSIPGISDAPATRPTGQQHIRNGPPSGIAQNPASYSHHHLPTPLPFHHMRTPLPTELMASSSFNSPSVTLLPVYVPEMAASDAIGNLHSILRSPQNGNPMMGYNGQLMSADSFMGQQQFPSHGNFMSMPFQNYGNQDHQSNPFHQASSNQQPAFKHSRNHPLDSLNQLLHNGFVSDINRIPQPFSYNHNHGLTESGTEDNGQQANRHGGSRRPQPAPQSSSFFPNIWSANSMLRQSIAAASRQPAADVRGTGQSQRANAGRAYDPFSGPTLIPGPLSHNQQHVQESRPLANSIPRDRNALTGQSGPMASHGQGGFGMPTVSDSIGRIVPAPHEPTPSEGYAILDESASQVIRAPHNPVTILQIFADAYDKHAQMGSGPVHGHSMIINHSSGSGNQHHQSAGHQGHQGSSMAASQSYPIFTAKPKK